MFLIFIVLIVLSLHTIIYLSNFVVEENTLETISCVETSNNTSLHGEIISSSLVSQCGIIG